MLPPSAKPHPGRVVLVLLGLAVVPFLLNEWIGAPIPHDWPTAEQWDSVLRGLTLDHFHALGRILLWAAWLAVLVGSIWEVAAYLRHRDRATAPARKPWFLRLTGALTLGTTATAALTAATPAAAVAETPETDVDTDESEKHSASDTRASEPTNATTDTNTSTDGVSTYTVQIGDNLWDIAKDELGKGEKWTTIYQHNEDRPQPDGGKLTDPDLIRPGWELSIDDTDQEPSNDGADSPAPDGSDAAPADPPHPEPGGDFGDQNPDTLPPLAESKPSLASADAHDENHRDDSRGEWPIAVWLGTAGVVAIGLVAGIVRTVRAARHRVSVYERRTGQLGPDIPLDKNLSNAASRAGARDAEADTPPAFAVDESGEAVAVTTLAKDGIGLTGPGAADTARAAIATCLASGTEAHESPHSMILATDDVLDTLTAGNPPQAWPSYRLHATVNNASLMRRLSREILARTRHHADDDSSTSDTIPLIVVATGESELARELSNLLDQANDLNLYGLVLGDWAHHTIHINADGTTSTKGQGNLQCHHIDVDTFTSILETLAAAEETLDEPISPPSEATSLVADDELLPQPGDTEPPATEDGHSLRFDTGDSLTTFDYDSPEAQLSANSSAVLTQRDSLTALPDSPSPSDTSITDDSTADALADSPANIVSKPAEVPHDQLEPTPILDPTASAHPPTGSTSESRPPLRLRLLGHADLIHRDEPVLIRRARGRELLARLAIDPDGVGLDELLEVACGDIKRTNARHHFQSILSQTRTDLRRHTGESTDTMFIQFTKQRYSLDPNWFTSDITEFETNLAAATAATDPGTRASHLTAAVDLYQGEFASELDSDGTWTLPLRENYADKASTACLHLAEHHRNDNNDFAAITILDKATTITPYRETIYALLVQVHLDSGDPEAAAKTYNRLKTRLAKISRTPSPKLRGLIVTDDR